jgi:hypothetical protein
MQRTVRWTLVVAAVMGCNGANRSNMTAPATAQSSAGTASSTAGSASVAAASSTTAPSAASMSTATRAQAGTGATVAGSAAVMSTAGTSSAAAGATSAGGADIDSLKTTGLTKYIGAAKPASMQKGSNGETQYTFDINDGPRCLRGAAYAMSTRDQGSDSLLIYLQGGGSCSSAVCQATTTAGPQIPAGGITSATDAQNPVAKWNVVYVPYCDGSLHIGDKDHETENPPRYHHGLRNLSAALDVGVASFPHPKRILLSGSSAGGLGTIWASVIVRLLYPEATLFTFNDSGVGSG